MDGDPVHISVDRTGKYLLSAHYYQARVGVHGFGEDGVLDATPIEWRETGIGAHYVQTDPSNRYAYVPHIAEGAHTGVNAIFQFRFDQLTGRLDACNPDRATPRTPEGPRHVCFHPNLDVVYASNEQGCSVTAYRFDRSDGTLHPFHTVPTLPDGYTEHNSCSQIQITPSGRFLYAPNRGHNSIAGFAVNPGDGTLTALGQTPTEDIPRAFSLDPTGNYLYAAGLESARLASYRVNADTGTLEPHGGVPHRPGPHVGPDGRRVAPKRFPTNEKTRRNGRVFFLAFSSKEKNLRIGQRFGILNVPNGLTNEPFGVLEWLAVAVIEAIVMQETNRFRKMVLERPCRRILPSQAA